MRCWLLQTEKIPAGKFVLQRKQKLSMISAEIQISAKLKSGKSLQTSSIPSKTQRSTIIKTSFDYFIHIFISPHYIKLITALRIYFFTNFDDLRSLFWRKVQLSKKPAHVNSFQVEGCSCLNNAVDTCCWWPPLDMQVSSKTHRSVRCDRDNVGTMRSDIHTHRYHRLSLGISN